MDAIRNLIKAAWGEVPGPVGSADSGSGLAGFSADSGLAGLSADSGLAGLSAGDFERRVMMAIARAESERLRRRVRWTAIAAAACLVGLLLSLPVDALIDGLGNAATEISASLKA